MEFMTDKPNTFLWLFDSTVSSSLKCEYSLGNPSIRKFRFLYTYKDRCKYLISQDSSLNNISLNNIRDSMSHDNMGEDVIKIADIDDLYWGGRIYFRSKICIDSSNRLLLNINSNDTITDSLYPGYKLIEGKMKSILIQNENYENQYLIKYDKPKMTRIVFYKPKSIMYMIVINDFEGFKNNDNGMKYLQLK
jgi:hypothetical protein